MYAISVPRSTEKGRKQGQLLFPLDAIRPGTRWAQAISPRPRTRDLEIFDLGRARIVAVQSRGRRRQLDKSECGDVMARFGTQLRLAYEATQSPFIAKVLATA